MSGNLFVFIALFGIIPVIVGLFAFLSPRKAVVWSFLIAWLFLPMAAMKLFDLINYNKMSAACFGVLLAGLLFDSETLFNFRPKIWDLPMFVWCICPVFSSYFNHLGFYDGFATAVYQTTFWGLPYFIGRLYFSDLAGLRELAGGIVIGGLLYVPLCLWEVRFSPQLHYKLYGFYQHDFLQTHRYGSFRPMVFMQHGLAVGMWMAAATLVAFWMGWSKNIRRLWGMPIWLVTGILLVTTVLCHSMGAVMLMLFGMALLAMTRWTKWPVWMLLLAIIPSTYMFVRFERLWAGDQLVRDIATTDTERAGSLDVRLRSENLLVAKAKKSVIFGWGGWNRFREEDETGEEVGVPDALWIIALGHNGLIGLISVTLSLTVPLLLLIWKIPPKYWHHQGAAPAAVLAVLSGLYMIDNLMNAMINPIFLMGAGGLCGLAFSLRGAQNAQRPQAGQRALAPRRPQSLPLNGGRAVARA